MAEFLIAQKLTTSDPWTLFINGRAYYSNSSLDGVIGYLRSMPAQDNPPVLKVALRTLVELEPPMPSGPLKLIGISG